MQKRFTIWLLALLIIYFNVTYIWAYEFDESSSSDSGIGYQQSLESISADNTNVIKDKTRVKELVEKRDLYSKHYLNTDGSITVETSFTPVHYLNDKGEYEDVDLNIVARLSRQNFFKL